MLCPGAVQLRVYQQVTANEMDLCTISGSSTHVSEGIPEGPLDYVFEIEENELSMSPQEAWCHGYFSVAM